jgi:hypothetical protein
VKHDFTPFALASVAHCDIKSFYRTIALAELRPIVGDKPASTQKHSFNANQALILLIVTDMMRAGIPGPRAARLACRFAETLLFAPDADRVTVQYHANGVGFFFTGDDAPEAACAAGAARFRLSFEVAEYRAVVERALAKRAAEMGEREDA